MSGPPKTPPHLHLIRGNPSKRPVKDSKKTAKKDEKGLPKIPQHLGAQENSGGLHGYNELLLQARESDNPEQAEIHNFLMLDIERRVYDLSRINDRLQAIN